LVAIASFLYDVKENPEQRLRVSIVSQLR
jgi:hypothetical protein